MRIGCVLLAAGNGKRFGTNKLLACYQGKPLIRCALEAVPTEALASVVVVSQYDAVLQMAREFGFSAVLNDAPEDGISRTVRLGTEAICAGCDGILYQVADQPLLRRETVLRLLEAFCTNPDRIVVPVAGEHRGNPCVFPAAFFPQLKTLEGDRGGSQIIKKHPEAVMRVEVAEEELADVDTTETLARCNEAAPSSLMKPLR